MYHFFKKIKFNIYKYPKNELSFKITGNMKKKKLYTLNKNNINYTVT